MNFGVLNTTTPEGPASQVLVPNSSSVAVGNKNVGHGHKGLECHATAAAVIATAQVTFTVGNVKLGEQRPHIGRRVAEFGPDLAKVLMLIRCSCQRCANTANGQRGEAGCQLFSHDPACSTPGNVSVPDHYQPSRYPKPCMPGVNALHRVEN